MANNEISIIVSLRDQASKEFSKIAASSDAAKAKISSLKGELAGMAAGAGIAGIGMMMAKSAMEWGKAVEDIVEQTGAAGEEASKMLVIAKATGIGTEEAAGSMAKFGKAISKSWDEVQTAAAKGEESNDVFSRLGITLEESDKTNLAQTFQKVAEKMRNMADGADKDRVAMEMFGKSGYKLYEMLNLTEEEIAKMTKKAEEMGLIISSESAEAAKKLDRQMTALAATTSKLATGIGMELVPVLQEKVTALQDVVSEYSKLDEAQRTAIANAVVTATEIGGITIAVKGLQAIMAVFGLSVINPWITLAAVIGGAALALYDYNTEQSKLAVKNGQTPQFDPTTGLAIPQIGSSLVPGNGDDSLFDKYEASNNYRAPKENKVEKTTTYRAPVASAGAASDKAAHELEKAQEKIADMIADLQGKIVSETGTTLEGNIGKLKSEVDKMQYDINQAVDKGVDTDSIAQAQAQLDQYSTTMKDKYLKVWRESWQDLKNGQASVNAELMDDKNAQADAEYNITKTRLDREREDKLKAVQQDGQDAEARLAVDKWYNDELALSEQKRQQKYRDNLDEKYQQTVEHNDLLATLEGRTQTEIDALNRSATEAYIAELQKRLKNDKLTAEERLRTEQNLADAQQSIWDANGRDLATANDEAMRRIKAQTHDYAADTVSTFNDMVSTVEDHLTNMLTGAESFSEGFKGIISDMCNDIIKMFVKMWTNQYVMGPLQSLFGSILGSTGGGTALTAGQQSLANTLLPTGFAHANGGVASGWSLVGEEGPELVNFTNPGRVYTASQTNAALSGGGTPSIQLNITNNSGSDVTAENTATSFDGQKYVIDIVLDAASRNVNGFGRNLKTALGGT